MPCSTKAMHIIDKQRLRYTQCGGPQQHGAWKKEVSCSGGVHSSCMHAIPNTVNEQSGQPHKGPRRSTLPVKARRAALLARQCAVRRRSRHVGAPGHDSLLVASGWQSRGTGSPTALTSSRRPGEKNGGSATHRPPFHSGPCGRAGRPASSHKPPPLPQLTCGIQCQKHCPVDSTYG